MSRQERFKLGVKSEHLDIKLNYYTRIILCLSKPYMPFEATIGGYFSNIPHLFDMHEYIDQTAPYVIEGIFEQKVEDCRQ